MPARDPGRYRSRSPEDSAQAIRTRSQSPHRRQHHQHRHHHGHHRSSPRQRQPPPPQALPFGATPISKNESRKYEPMFALYLSIQKQLEIGDLPDREVKGRWKSFVSKWNHGDLAEGWYDPDTLRKARESQPRPSEASPALKQPPMSPDDANTQTQEDTASEDDEVGPNLPQGSIPNTRGAGRLGPTIPTSQDLVLTRELEEDALAASREELRRARKADRKMQKEQLEEVAPRAEAGTRDRMLEKKKERADSNRAFAAAKTDAAGMEEVGESDLYGADDGGIEGLRKEKKEMERRKNKREQRKDEILRARREEREERIQEYRAKEARTMSGLVALARARFGSTEDSP